ncbi:exosome complex exonuclease RRP42 [Hetaerina americana]|uniref:exosome complex exonuclease RRP42 n=1 Tax=Hetaerina americana TaxID=62018 RepID=UPI003A7F5950
MALKLLSDAEKMFILHGVKDDFRCDGRTRREYRPIEVETEIVSNASGSARVRLANTDVLVGVKTEIDIPNPDRPTEGKLEFFVDCSANATPAFEGRGGEELAYEISSSLSKAYGNQSAFDLRPLCILPGQQCWKLYVDILILECGGNLFDGVSLAVKAALFNTKVPRISSATVDGGVVDLQLSDDPYDYQSVNVSSAPLLVTLTKIGEHCVVDPSAEEEACSLVSAVVAVTEKGKYVTSFVRGEGSLHPDTLIDMLKVGQSLGVDMNKELNNALKMELSQGENRERCGFLK